MATARSQVSGDATEQHDPLTAAMMQFFALRWVLDPGQAVPGLGATVSESLAMTMLAGGDLTQQDLGGRMGLEKSTVSRLVDGLIRKGWVGKERHPTQRRFHNVCLTDTGRKAAGAIAHAMHERHSNWLGAMTEEERTAIAVGLPALLRVIAKDFGPLGS